MKKTRLGKLTVYDKGIFDTTEEVITGLLEKMQKYVTYGKMAYEKQEYTTAKKLEQVRFYAGRFCALSEFLTADMGVEVRGDDNFLYTQEMYNKFHYWEQMLSIELKREEGREA